MSDSVWQQRIYPILSILKRKAANTTVWGFGYYEYLRVFTRVARILNVPVVPYLTRHSGASIDRASGL